MPNKKKSNISRKLPLVTWTTVRIFPCRGKAGPMDSPPSPRWALEAILSHSSSDPSAFHAVVTTDWGHGMT
jgi:hypothetical protein